MLLIECGLVTCPLVAIHKYSKYLFKKALFPFLKEKEFKRKMANEYDHMHVGHSKAMAPHPGITDI